MAREFNEQIEAVRTSLRFEVATCLIIALPLNAGDASRIVIRAATEDVFAEDFFSYTDFTYSVFIAVLKRAPTTAEQAAWVNALIAAAAISPAALVTEAGTRIYDLFHTAAYTALDTTDEAFITDFYAAYYGRTPDPDGKGFWLTNLASGGTRDGVLVDAGGQPEFSDRMATVGSPQHFIPHIKSTSAISLVDGQAIDNVDVVLTNLSNTYSTYLAERDRVLYPAPAAVYRAYLAADGKFYLDPVLYGFAKFSNISGDEAKVTIVSDMSRKGLSIVEVVPQRCPKVYRGPGCESPDPSPTCSRVWDDNVNGCESKAPALVLIGATNNQPSFGGGPDAAVKATGDSTVVTGGGTGDDGDGSYIDPRDPRYRFPWKFEQAL